MPDEEHLTLVAGDAVPAVGDCPDLDDDPVPHRHAPGHRCDGPAPISPATKASAVSASGSPRRRAPGA
jgi:hypothetical protein